MTLSLSKLHGLGNDFLVIDAEQAPPGLSWAKASQRWCDRRRGVGADGLLILGWDGHRENTTRLTMALYNADGSRAEMSGNGIRCLVHAAYRLQRRTGDVTYSVATDAGQRLVEVHASDPTRIEASVTMGDVSPVPEPAQWSLLGAHPDRPVVHVSLGNPHTVVGVDDVAVVDLATLGATLSEVNLEIVEPGPEPHAITMRVHERGVGITQACGTGACAAAWAAVRWGLVPPTTPRITVHMDGGDAHVVIGQPTETSVTLYGPSVHIAEVMVMP